MKKALFLDRDGVLNELNEGKAFISKIEDFRFKRGVFETLRYFQENGYLLIIVTNQSGIGVGLYKEEDYHILNDYMLDKFVQEGIEITEVFYSPFHKDGFGKYKKDSDCRKPRPGMILNAVKKYDIDVKQSIMVGDKPNDVKAGMAAGIEDLFLVSTGAKYDEESIENLPISKIISHIDELKEIY